MKLDRLPIRLGAEPLLEAVCEMRFAASFPASNILPGLLLQGLQTEGNQISMQRLPASNLPKEMREIDPALRDAALIALKWGGRNILIGDSIISVSCGRNYPGWMAFRADIEKVFRIAAGSQIIQSITRFSLKYIDLIPGGHLEIAGGLDISLKLGELALSRQNTVIRIEAVDPPFLHVVNAMTAAEAAQEGAVSVRGSLIDVDTLHLSQPTSVQEFMDRLAENLDDAHARNKRVFFECLTQETLSKLEPSYD
jgi:uncharacterized protein (TIGR04255 family)